MSSLSATEIVQLIAAQRALTVANNVAIDVSTAATTRGSQSDAAVNIAHQIAAKVPTT